MKAANKDSLDDSVASHEIVDKESLARDISSDEFDGVGREDKLVSRSEVYRLGEDMFSDEEATWQGKGENSFSKGIQKLESKPCIENDFNQFSDNDLSALKLSSNLLDNDKEMYQGTEEDSPSSYDEQEDSDEKDTLYTGSDIEDENSECPEKDESPTKKGIEKSKKEAKNRLKDIFKESERLIRGKVIGFVAMLFKFCF
jgi:hypothetical protein